MLGARVIAVAVGYCFGLFQTGYIYGEKHGVDIRTQGSGNAGTTNTLRVLGWKAGLITFLGDLFKAIFAVLLIRFIFIGKYPDAIKILELYAGFGAVLGHNFPFYLKFKGGKGIACTSGMILAVCPLAAPICLILSLVTPGVSFTMEIRSPASTLNNVDFPTFGRPTIATTGLLIISCTPFNLQISCTHERLILRSEHYFDFTISCGSCKDIFHTGLLAVLPQNFFILPHLHFSGFYQTHPHYTNARLH